MLLWGWTLGLVSGGSTLCPAEGSNYYILLVVFNPLFWTLNKVRPLNPKASRLGRPQWEVALRECLSCIDRQWQLPIHELYISPYTSSQKNHSLCYMVSMQESNTCDMLGCVGKRKQATVYVIPNRYNSVNKALFDRNSLGILRPNFHLLYQGIKYQYLTFSEQT